MPKCWSGIRRTNLIMSNVYAHIPNSFIKRPKKASGETNSTSGRFYLFLFVLGVAKTSKVARLSAEMLASLRSALFLSVEHPQTSW